MHSNGKTKDKKKIYSLRNWKEMYRAIIFHEHLKKKEKEKWKREEESWKIFFSK